MPDGTIGDLGLTTPIGTMKVPVENASGTANGYVTIQSIGTATTIAAGTLASRPATGTVGRLYFVTDAATPHLTFDDGTNWLDCVINGTYTPSTSAPIEVLAAGGAAITATNEGERRALIHVRATDTDDTNLAGIVVDHVQRTHGVDTIVRSGVHIRTYTEGDNGGDVSGLLIGSSGGGPAFTAYKHYGLRPAGYTDQSLSQQPCVELGSGDAGAALVASAGSSQWGTPLRNHAIEAVLGAAAGANQSDGILIRAINDVFDNRIALAVCTPSLNAAPVNVTARLDMNGDLTLTHTLNVHALTNGEIRTSNNTNDASSAAFTLKKSRNNGPVNVNEIIGDIVWACVDAGSSERTAARWRGTATAVGAGVVSGDLIAFLSDVGTEAERFRITSSGETLLTGPNGSTWRHGRNTELLTLSTSGTTTDTSANLLPANSIIEAVVARVTTTIGTATDWKLGDPTTAGRFTAANATMTAGTTDVGLLHWSGAVSTLATGPSQPSAAKVRVTTTGTPSAGAIRITVFYRTFTALTS